MIDVATLIATALGSGGAATVATAWIRSRTVERKNERKADAKILDDLRSILRDERDAKDTERAALHFERAGHAECLDRVMRLETRLALLEAEHSSCPDRIAALEQQIERLMPEALRAYARPDMTPTKLLQRPKK